MNYLKDIVKKQKSGIAVGIYSACTANSYVLEAVMEHALETNNYAVIEATSNQVNQFGGYTGMKPIDYKNFVYGIAEKVNFPKEKIILGGDHLGPLTWQNQREADAMENSAELIRQYVLAGFTKIHIDTSMRLADDDKNAPLSVKTMAKRAAAICKESEKAYKELQRVNPNAESPVYVLGSEVPIPGGVQHEEEHISVTQANDFTDTYETFIKVFAACGLEKAFKNVIAVVVQMDNLIL